MTGRHDRLCALLVVLLAGFSTMPLLQRHLFASSDGLYHLYRLVEYDAALRAGVWYPRWAPDFFYGLGMPLFNYYAPLTYYLAEVFHLLGAGYVDSMRLLVAVAMALSGVGAYAYSRLLLSPPSSLLASVVYMYVPYHLVNLYYRGDIAEYLAYTWFPFILWALGRLLETRRFVFLFAGSIFYGALIITHNLSAFIFSGFLVVYAGAALLRYRSGLAKARQWRGALPGALSLGAMALAAAALSAFFWIPAILEAPLVDFDRLLYHYDFREHFPTLGELLSGDLIHRYGVVFSTAEVYGYKLGLWQAIFLVVAPVALIWRWRRCSAGLRTEAVASVLVAATALWLMAPASTWLWENVPFLSLAQFPWRFLTFMALPSALLAGLLVELAPGRIRWMAAGLLVPLVIASSVAGLSPILSHVQEADISPRGSIGFELSYGTVGTSAAAEYLPRWVKERPTTSAVALSAMLGQQVGSLAGRTTPGIEAAVVERGVAHAAYLVRAAKAGELTANVLYFPGWVASIDGHETGIAVDDPTGLIKLAVPEGEHTVTLRFGETPLRTGANLVSALAVLFLLGVLVRDWRRQSWVSVSIPVFGLNREALAALAVAGGLALIWLPAKAAYDAANAWPNGQRFPLAVNMDDEVLLEGYDVAGGRPSLAGRALLYPGQSLEVSIFWRPLRDGVAKSYRPFFRLSDNLDQTWAYAESPTAHPAASETIATTLTLPVPAGTPPGVYQLEVGLSSDATKQPLRMRRVRLIPILPTEKNVWLGPVIVGRGVGGAPTGLESPSSLATAVEFGNGLRLLDLSLSDGEAFRSGRPGAPLPKDSRSGGWQVHAGAVVHLNLLWQALEKLDDDLIVTARLASADRMLWSIRDSRPANGTYPTPFWSAGEVVRDQLSLAIPPTTPPGLYEVQLEVLSRSGPLSILDSNLAPAGPTLRIGSLAVLPAATPADPLTVEVQWRLSAPLSDGLAILGYSLGRPALQPGEQLKVDLIWGMAGDPGRDVTMRLSLVDKTGGVWADESGRPVGDAYPTSAWRKGEVLLGQYSLTPRAAAPEGEVDLVLDLLDSTTGQSLTRRSLDRVRILARSRSFAAAPTRPLVKVFGDKIRLLGFDLAGGTGTLEREVPQLVAGDTLIVTAHWQGVAEMRTNYTVFTQMLNAAGRLVVQDDAWPQGGKAPTTGWLRDEVVTDEHRIAIPPSLAEGEYTLITGFYDASSGKRLPVEGAGDFVVLTRLRLAAKE